MDTEGFLDEWDAAFVDELVQAEELALSTQASRIPPQPTRPPPPPPPMCDVSYSPPRQLSQRVPETSLPGIAADGCFDTSEPRETYSAKQQEIDTLKQELNRVSKRLNSLEQECTELKRAKDKKEEELKVTKSRVEGKDAEFNHTKSTERDCVINPGIPAVCQNTNSGINEGQNVGRSTVGIDTNETAEASTSAAQNGYCGSEKLISLWNSREQKLGRVLVAKLFVTCEADFQVLSGCLNSPQNASGVGPANKSCPAQPIEATKVSYLYNVLTMISNDALRLEDLLEALMDLCNLKNVLIIHSSLRVLHTILSHSFPMEKEFGRRENVLVEESSLGNTDANTSGCGHSESKNLFSENLAKIFKEAQIPSGLNLSNVEDPGHSMFSDQRFGTSISGSYWVSLFERTCQVAVNNNKEQLRHEALSVMNLILMRQNAYLEREKFAGKLVFLSLSQLLRRGAGFSVQDQAVHTLYLLCNCPTVIARLCSGFKEDDDVSSSKGTDEKNYSTVQELNDLLTSFADCVASYGSSSAKEMKLRRNAIVFLAFLGSSGNSGVEILHRYQLPKGRNFLQIILQSLISDLDLQAPKPTPPSSVVREQWLLIRETLIFFNRLVSHPQHSVPVLQALTNTRELASITVDIANRLTNKTKLMSHNEITTKQIRESEIVDLAWVFKKRVFAFLGENIS